MTETATKPQPAVGDIIYSAGGYDCTIAKFYEVIAASGQFVTLQPISKGLTEDDGRTAYVVPTGQPIGKPIRRKVKQYAYSWGSFWSISISRYETAQDIWTSGGVQVTSPFSL